MARQLNEILHEPPIAHDLQELVADKKQLSPAWQRWMTNLHSAIRQIMPIGTLQTVDGIQHASLTQAAKFATAEADAVQNWEDGQFYYDTTLNKFRFRENGTWKEIP